MEGSKKSISWLELLVVIGLLTGVVSGMFYFIKTYGPEVKATQSQQVEFKREASK